MLKKLGENLRQWKPSAKSLTPIDLIRTAWVGIVGPEVARHCFPVEIRVETLLVVTRSGTWSQQLGFLETNILAAIAALDDVVSITELRFRVGKIAQQQAHPAVQPSRVQQALRLSTTPPEDASVHDMIARLKKQSAQRQKVRGPRCSRCMLMLDSGSICAPCRQREREERIHSAMRALTEVPWLKDDDLRHSCARIGDDELAAARRNLASRWKRELDRLEKKKTFGRGEPERVTAVSYALLVTGLDPDCLTRAITRYTLGPRLDTLLYGETTS